uniref:Uncharacterized protein TCIL3000_11_6270 n=1 Tax=Trypanosoma congolense (strain IL3000) TaxID=1068625 RepID=G0V0N3_TRYCI|nr:unnamed protein product [Trypanosoma congolense IL3000]
MSSDGRFDYTTRVTVLSRTIVYKQQTHPLYKEGPVALKVTASRHSIDTAWHPSLHEANVYKLLGPHPSIPDFVECVEDWFDTDCFQACDARAGRKCVPILVIQFVKAVPLERFLSSVCTIRWSVAMQILRQVVTVLEHVHSKGIVYRDLKLPNLILDRAGHVWLVDYASSIVVGSVDLAGDVTQHIGAPELYRPLSLCDGELSPPRLPFMTDFWAFGAFVLELLTCRPYLGSFSVRSFQLSQCELNEKVIEGVALAKVRYKGVFYDKKPKSNGCCSSKVLWESLTDLLMGLLQVNPADRLGYNGGWADVRGHSFMQNILTDAPTPFPEEYEDEVDELTLGL